MRVGIGRRQPKTAFRRGRAKLVISVCFAHYFRQVVARVVGFYVAVRIAFSANPLCDKLASVEQKLESLDKPEFHAALCKRRLHRLRAPTALRGSDNEEERMQHEGSDYFRRTALCVNRSRTSSYVGGRQSTGRHLGGSLGIERRTAAAEGRKIDQGRVNGARVRILSEWSAIRNGKPSILLADRS